MDEELIPNGMRVRVEIGWSEEEEEKRKKKKKESRARVYSTGRRVGSIGPLPFKKTIRTSKKKPIPSVSYTAIVLISPPS